MDQAESQHRRASDRNRVLITIASGLIVSAIVWAGAQFDHLRRSSLEQAIEFKHLSAQLGDFKQQFEALAKDYTTKEQFIDHEMRIRKLEERRGQ